jgi:hypothetical protein
LPETGIPTETRHAISDLAGVEHKDVNAAGRESLYIGHCSLPFCAPESHLDGRQIIELQSRDQVITGRADWRRDGTMANGLPLKIGFTAGEPHDNQLCSVLLN